MRERGGESSSLGSRENENQDSRRVKKSQKWLLLITYKTIVLFHIGVAICLKALDSIVVHGSRYLCKIRPLEHIITWPRATILSLEANLSTMGPKPKPKPKSKNKNQREHVMMVVVMAMVMMILQHFVCKKQAICVKSMALFHLLQRSSRLYRTPTEDSL